MVSVALDVESQYAKLASDGFATKRLKALEESNYLERFLPCVQLRVYANLSRVLWPSSEASKSRQWSLLVILILWTKRCAQKDTWRAISDCGHENELLKQTNDELVRQVLRDVLEACLDSSLSFTLRDICVSVTIDALNNLDLAVIRKLIQPLVSILTWQRLGDQRRAQIFKDIPVYKKRYKLRMKAHVLDTREEANGSHENHSDVNWLYRLAVEVIKLLNIQRTDTETLKFCTSSIELFADLMSRLATRRYTKVLLEDLAILPAIKLSFRYIQARAVGSSLRAATAHLEHYMSFPIDDYTGQELTSEESNRLRAMAIEQLQSLAFTDHKDHLLLLALSNSASIETRSELEAHLDGLPATELYRLCDSLSLRTRYEDHKATQIETELLKETLLSRYQKIQSSNQVTISSALLPSAIDQRSEESSSVTSSQPLQYLSVSDFLHRAFQETKSSLISSLLDDALIALGRAKPVCRGESSTTFDGYSPNVLKLESLSGLEALPPHVDVAKKPAAVRANIALDLSSLRVSDRLGWESLQSGDILCFLQVNDLAGKEVFAHDSPDLAKIKALRCALVDSPATRMPDGHSQNNTRGHKIVHVLFDTHAFGQDQARDMAEDIYHNFNIVIKRKSSKNRPYKVLENIQKLAKNPRELTSKAILDIFLGNETGQQDMVEHNSLCMYDTFLSLEHARDSLPIDSIIDNKATNDTGQSNRTRQEIDFQLRLIHPSTAIGTTKHNLQHSMLPSQGPYTADIRKRNNIRFSHEQIQAIIRAMTHKVTLIDGVPGSGKNLISAQIASNLYHTEREKLLIVCKTEESIDRLLEILAGLDIEARHVIRLGETRQSSKLGDIRNLVDRRKLLLEKVKRLATAMQIAGDHSSSCETAAYFFATHVEPRWKTHLSAQSDDLFGSFFANIHDSTHVSMDPNDVTICQHYIRRIFEELADLRPLELLTAEKERSRYFMRCHARIVLTTASHLLSEHAGLADEHLSFDSIIFMQAMALVDLEVFFALMVPSYKSQLKRCIFIGDSRQTIQNNMVQIPDLRSTKNLTFLRLLRTGVSCSSLVLQGRSRPSITRVFQRQYPQLGHLPEVTRNSYLLANAGLAQHMQLINVVDFQGQGEFCPRPGAFQNLGEAEYTVAMFRYMRTINYPASTIVILTPYTDQKALILDVLSARCRNFQGLDLPEVATVAEYQGRQKDYVLLSLVRTKHSSEPMDRGLLNTAMSRARLGLYVFSRRDLLSKSAPEIVEHLDVVKSCKLHLIADETYPSEREVDELPADRVVEIDDVVHFGRYIQDHATVKVRETAV